MSVSRDTTVNTRGREWRYGGDTERVHLDCSLEEAELSGLRKRLGSIPSIPSLCLRLLSFLLSSAIQSLCPLLCPSAWSLYEPLK